jgi:hypothetical protein
MVVNIRVEQHLARLLRTTPGAVKHEREKILEYMQQVQVHRDLVLSTMLLFKSCEFLKSGF